MNKTSPIKLLSVKTKAARKSILAAHQKIGYPFIKWWQFYMMSGQTDNFLAIDAVIL